MGDPPVWPGTWPLDHPNVWPYQDVPMYEIPPDLGPRQPLDRLPGRRRGVTKSPKRKRR